MQFSGDYGMAHYSKDEILQMAVEEDVKFIRLQFSDMFGNLKNYRSEAYMRAHRELWLYTPESTLCYTIFGALTYDDRLITMVYDDADPDSRAAFLESVLSSDGLFLTDGLEINTDSHLITLSTCIGGMPNNRLLVLGVLSSWEPQWLSFMQEKEGNT